MIRITIPYPPSSNRLHRRVGPRVLLSREGRQYRKDVAAILAAQHVKPLDGPVAMRIELYPPDRRRRDIDNALKATLDSCEHGRAIHNDCQVEHLEVRKHEPKRGGKAVVELATVTEFERRRKLSGTHSVACCSGCGRDVFRRVDQVGDVYCDGCIEHGATHAFPEEIDREPLGEPEWFGGHIKHDLDQGHDDWDEDL